MKMKPPSVEDYRIVSSFQSVRNQLKEDKYNDRLEKPLAYWALPNDRRLPLALLGRSLKELIDTPFEEIAATPGIGHKKITSLVKLLNRATKDHPPGVSLPAPEVADKKPFPALRKGQKFDPTIVSEALWAEWRDTVMKHGIGRTKLGRIAPTLQALPTVIWHTPLEEYMDHTVAEIRSMKTHGEKRVRVILEVFCVAYEILATAGTGENVSVRLAPKFIEPLEHWLHEQLAANELPSAEQIKQNFTIPLLDQLLVDAGPTVHRLAEERLGIHGAPQSVRLQSRRLGITRARVYQLLEDCGKIMEVRWPEGRWLVKAFANKLVELGAKGDDLQGFTATCELFFPNNMLFEEETAGEGADEFGLGEPEVEAVADNYGNPADAMSDAEPIEA
jgi:hypothetical protein